MAEVSIRDLRNHGGEVIDRVETGEQITVTRSGKAVAELRRLQKVGPDPITLLERWRHIPIVDPHGFRADIDELIDPSL